MKAVVQRVKNASVAAGSTAIGEIGLGLLVLVGVTHGDTPADAATLAAKLGGLRIFRDHDGLMNRSVTEVGGAVLVVSQFTLYADARKGRRPSFAKAAPPTVAEKLVSEVVARLAAAGLPVSTGCFGATMEVSLVNDGPVTVILEARDGKIV